MREEENVRKMKGTDTRIGSGCRTSSRTRLTTGKETEMGKKKGSRGVAIGPLNRGGPLRGGKKEVLGPKIKEKSGECIVKSSTSWACSSKKNGVAAETEARWIACIRKVRASGGLGKEKRRLGMMRVEGVIRPSMSQKGAVAVAASGGTLLSKNGRWRRVPSRDNGGGGGWGGGGEGGM